MRSSRALLPLVLATALAAALVATPAPASQEASAPRWQVQAAEAAWQQLGDPAWPDPPPPTPGVGVADWAPQPPGTVKKIDLNFGPYTIGPGSDLSRIDFATAGATGYSIGMWTQVVEPDGTVLHTDLLHVHHAHLLKFNPDNPQYFDWLYGTGEEMTGGSIQSRGEADPREGGHARYGGFARQGEHLGALSMLHNRTAQTWTVYLRFRILFVYGTAKQIAQTRHWQMHALEPVIFGGTFNVPRTGGDYVWPMDVRRRSQVGSTTVNPVGKWDVDPGVGFEWTAPWTGTIVVTAGHLHAGGTDAILSNIGTPSDPCPNSDGDRFAGETLADSRVITRKGVFPSAEYQMGITKPGWRAYIRKGDRLVINGVYDARDYAFPDAMLFFGIYVDRSQPPKPSQVCTAELVDEPGASHAQVTRTLLNHAWPGPPEETCTKCDHAEKLPKPGSATEAVHIANFVYLPGQEGMSGQPAGPPVVAQGQGLTFYNEDYALGAMRHTVTSCTAPCDGEPMVNYPFSSGRFESGPLGYMFEDAYVTTKTYPQWTLNTSHLKPGYYTYYCRIHAFMRGSFYVVKNKTNERAQALAIWHRVIARERWAR